MVTDALPLKGTVFTKMRDLLETFVGSFELDQCLAVRSIEEKKTEERENSMLQKQNNNIKTTSFRCRQHARSLLSLTSVV